MPLADKIIKLRKKQGWSQIDLADRLDVSRQSVSKWEMAQAVPELDKIIKMSELFAVTTDYLLKDEPPAPEPGGSAPPAPVQEPQPAPEAEAPAAEEAKTEKKPRQRKRRWVMAACMALAVCLGLALALNGAAIETGVLAYRDMPSAPATPVPQPSPTPVAGEAASAGEDQAQETAVAEPWLGLAVTEADGTLSVPQQMSEFTVGQDAVTGGGVDPAAMEAIAAEYTPFGVTYEDGQWLFEGQPIRVFTDVLSSNGGSLTGGDFQGVMRNFAGEGTVDVRAVRDYDRPGRDGFGVLMGMESTPVEGGEAVVKTARLTGAELLEGDTPAAEYTLTYENDGDFLPSRMRLHVLDGSAPDTLTYYEYDADGRMVSRRSELEDKITLSERWTYDGEGRLTRYDETSYTSSDGPETRSVAYEYDSGGRCFSAREDVDGGAGYEREYVYGDGDRPTVMMRWARTEDGGRSGTGVEETCYFYQDFYQDELLSQEEQFVDGSLRRSTEYTYPVGYGWFTVRASTAEFDENGLELGGTVSLIRRDSAGEDVISFQIPGMEDLDYDGAGFLLRAGGDGRTVEFTYG